MGSFRQGRQKSHDEYGADCQQLAVSQRFLENCQVRATPRRASHKPLRAMCVVCQYRHFHEVQPSVKIIYRLIHILVPVVTGEKSIGIVATHVEPQPRHEDRRGDPTHNRPISVVGTRRPK